MRTWKNSLGKSLTFLKTFLTDRGIEIENDERDEAMCEDNGLDYVNIFGSDYDEIADAIEDMIRNF